MIALEQVRGWLRTSALVLFSILLATGDASAQTDSATLKREIVGGQRIVAALKNQEGSFDSNQEILEYLNQVVAKLLVSSPRKAPYPITVHFSSVPQVNAHSLPGGPIVIDERMFDMADTEAQFVAVIAHEVAHELNNDFLNKKSDYLREHPGSSDPMNFKITQWSELRADRDGARLMYDAGWDPQGMIDLFGRQTFPTGGFSHPFPEERIKAIKSVMEKLPPKPGLTADSARFRELKAKY